MHSGVPGCPTASPKTSPQEGVLYTVRTRCIYWDYFIDLGGTLARRARAGHLL